MPVPKSFADDVGFLGKHQEVAVLGDAEKRAQVLICPAYQGRVMTSTADGDRGRSFGWINYDLIASGQTKPHINPYGGEDRLWLGPEGGQFSVFFPMGAPFEFSHWQTPKAFDTEPFELVGRTASTASFRRYDIVLTNYSGTRLQLKVDRDVSLLGPGPIASLLGVTPAETVKSVGFETRNSITNTGPRAWRKRTGTLSLWVLGMLKASPSVTVVVPHKPGDEKKLGPIVNQAYFGRIPAERLVVKEGVLYFKADGRYRSKIGVPPRRALPVAGSYDAQNGVLTIVQFSMPGDRDDYVNSLWKLQDDPYRGDVVNSYNDGPLEDGSQLGPFYELESSSPAAVLEPGDSLTHVHRTFHFEGPREALSAIAKAVLGVDLAAIEAALGS